MYAGFFMHTQLPKSKNDSKYVKPTNDGYISAFKKNNKNMYCTVHISGRAFNINKLLNIWRKTFLDQHSEYYDDDKPI